MTNFSYKGVIPASKSLMNRALICSSFSDHLKLMGDSSCDDVSHMKACIAALGTSTFSSGAAGTVFRFMALRLSRLEGEFKLFGTTRLLQRPQKDLFDLLERLGASVTMHEDHWRIKSHGWKNFEQPIYVSREVSSQFVSSLVLNAWNLEKELVLDLDGPQVSEGYFDMTLKVVEQLGMNFQLRGSQLHIEARSKITVDRYVIESDVSSLFAVAAFAALNGTAKFLEFPRQSLQPDIVFVDILQKMGATISFENDPVLTVQKTGFLRGVEVNLNSCPDLFPVLATLCAFAKTKSRLYGAAQLVHKESNRIAKVAELLEHLKVPHKVLPDGMEIAPTGLEPTRWKEDISHFKFHTDHDHRLAFAAALVKSQGFAIEIVEPEVVSKSFPEFWNVVNLNPLEK